MYRLRCYQKSLCATVFVLLSSGHLVAQPIPELEPINDAPPGQLGLPGAPFWSAEGTLVPGDLDFYIHGPALSFAPGPPMITASIFTDVSLPGSPVEDTLIGAFGPPGLGAPFSLDDDDNPGLNSSHHFSVAPGTPLFHGITGFPDISFAGGHAISAPFYRFVVSSGGPPEFEFNGTIATANPLPPLIAGATAREGFLLPGDVDYYSLTIAAGAFVTASTFDFTPIGAPAMDTLLGVFGPGGGFLGSDDDDGPSLLSALAFVAPVTGIYSFAVTGFGDPDFDGTGHTEDGHYRLVVSVPVPEPSSLLLCTPAVFAAGLRRRRFV